MVLPRRIVTALFLTVAAVLPTSLTPSRTAIETALADLSRITAFPLRHPVAFESITRGQVNRFLQDRIQESIKPEELRAEELMLKKFGFVPPEFDLRQNTLDLLTEQTAAFYDYRRKKLYITDWAASTLQEEALVHELAHALADQNFSLERFNKKVENDSEQSLARQAVVEGQASLLMRLVMATRASTPAKTLETTPEAAPAPFPVFDQSPLYLRRTLLFPYDAGETFQQAVRKRLGQNGFSQVFQHPPTTTQQVLHPDLYFAGLVALQPALPEFKGMRRVMEGSLGELEHSILLENCCGETASREVAPKWRGARFRLYEDKKSARTVLIYRSSWYDPESAQRYFHFYRQALAKKWKKMLVAVEDENHISGQGDDGFFNLTCQGANVTSREGFSSPPL